MGKKMEEWGRGWKMRMEDGEMNAQPTIEIARVHLSSILYPPSSTPLPVTRSFFLHKKRPSALTNFSRLVTVVIGFLTRVC
jgi:hypothetical protein